MRNVVLKVSRSAAIRARFRKRIRRVRNHPRGRPPAERIGLKRRWRDDLSTVPPAGSAARRKFACSRFLFVSAQSSSASPMLRRDEEKIPIVAANRYVDISRAASNYDPFVTNKRPTTKVVWPASATTISPAAQNHLKFCRARRRALARRLQRTVPQFPWHLFLTPYSSRT